MSGRPTAISRTSAKCSPPPASPPVPSIGCSPGARQVPGRHEPNKKNKKTIGPARMNRTGLVIALAIAAVVGVVFAVFPRLDLDISALFYDRNRDIFIVNAQLWVYFLRNAARGLITLLVAPAFLAAIGKVIWPRRRMLIEGR